MVFVLPRENKTYFGTTDTDYTGDLEHPTVTQEDVDYLLGIVNNRFPEAHITIDDIESSWAGLRPLISGNSASDYNGGNNGTISDESFNALIATVEGYLSKEKSREDVESAISHLEGSTSEKHLDPSAVSRGSSLDRDDNGLLTLAGGKITDYRKMAEGAMERVVEISKQNSTAASNSSTRRPTLYQAENSIQRTWIPKSKPLLNLVYHVAWTAKKLTT